ncbi:right-handed parallel beta-helix repeat-containing protein [Colwellia piezophila]|uniref:right-handed parallel beta-helix repeat-containing protein n=1 Tax=Colwellia piezophila TaxID=211668 RepID=UPI00036BB605|nr:right-handed parallel beta-helix repeat-containing protein [Colwellia piezophila]
MKRLLSIFLLSVFSIPILAQSYYINPQLGKDSNDGKSPDAAYKSLNQVQKIHLEPGDKLLLAAGVSHWGELKLHNIAGTEKKPIIVSSYQAGENASKKANDKVTSSHATINARGFYHGISIINSKHLQVSNFNVTAPEGFIYDWVKKQRNKKNKAMRIGVKLEASKKGTFSGIKLDNIIVNNVYFNKVGLTRSIKETHTANGTESYSFGIRAFAKKGGKFDNLVIQNSRISNVSHTGIKLNGKKGSFTNATLSNNKVFDIGGPGMQMSGALNVHVVGNIIKNPGSTKDSRNWGRGSGMWTWGSSHVLVEYNKFLNANGPADSAGFHIDFNCDNIIIQYNISANNAGGFIEILGNNYNNAYRYNVSINDGYRIKKKGVAAQEGKTFWFSGFVGKGKKRHGPYNSYIYNNTIYVKKDILSKIAVTRVSKGALIANNIFHIVGDSKAVKGDQYSPETNGISHISDVHFTNNIFLKASNWPESILIQDSAPIFGDVQFANAGGDKLTDYIPSNKTLVENKGIEIPLIVNDRKGLFKGLKVKHDILGNPIIGRPDMGAIEISKAL